MDLYKLENRNNVCGSNFIDSLKILKLDRLLFKSDRNTWAVAITTKSYDFISNYIDKLNSDYNTSINKNRNLLLTARRYQQILDSLTKFTLLDSSIDEFNLVARTHDYEEDDIISDLSNSGFMGISISRSKSGNMKVLLSGSIGDGKTYKKALTAGSKYSLKFIIYNLLLVRCRMNDIKIPYMDNLDYSRAYKFASILNYNGDPRGNNIDLPINIGKLSICQSKTHKSTRNKLLKATSSTGYKNISLDVRRDSVYLTLHIQDANKNDMDLFKSIPLDYENDYKESFKELLKLRCEYDSIPFPEDINYEIGIATLKRLFMETSDKKEVSIYKNNPYLDNTNTGYKNIHLTYKLDNKNNRILTLGLSVSNGIKNVHKTFTVYGLTIKNNFDTLIKYRCDLLDLEIPTVINYDLLIKNMGIMLNEIGASDRINKGLEYDLENMNAVDMFRHYKELKTSGSLKNKIKEYSGTIYKFKSRVEKSLRWKILDRLGIISSTLLIDSDIDIDNSKFKDWCVFITKENLLKYREVINNIVPNDKHEKISKKLLINSLDNVFKTQEKVTGTYRYIEVLK